MTPTEILLAAWLALCPNQYAYAYDPFYGRLHYGFLYQTQPNAFWPTSQCIEIQTIDENGFDAHVFKYARNNFEPFKRPVRSEHHYDRSGAPK